MPNNVLTDRVARRLKSRREALELTQQELSDRLGFNSRQTLADIEGGKRPITADELARASELLDVELDYFTDPFRLVDEGRFSFRAEGVRLPVIDSFQQRAGTWIATYRTLSEQAGIRPSFFGVKLELTKESSFEEAEECGEQLRMEWDLGNVPAENLENAIDRELGAQVLYVDAPSGISGAALRLPGLNAVFVNRKEPVGRRYFDLAHELFHILTWDAMPPERVEAQETQPLKGNRVERLADTFASALLMPRDVVEERWGGRPAPDLHEWLNVTATSLRVSSVALKFRAKNLGLISKGEIEALSDKRLAHNGGLNASAALPPLFNAAFVRRAHQAVESGRLSLRKAARLLDLDLPGFADLCQSYGLSLSYNS